MSPWRELLDNPFWLFLLDGLLMLLFVVFSYRTQIRLILKSLARNPVRTLLTSVATIILVVLVTGVWTILWFLDLVTEEKTKDLKAIVTGAGRSPARCRLPTPPACRMERRPGPAMCIRRTR